MPKGECMHMHPKRPGRVIVSALLLEGGVTATPHSLSSWWGVGPVPPLRRALLPEGGAKATPRCALAVLSSTALP